ncbi:hypothetical protein BHS06_01750 [Myxococcus xanthus]|uniref:hypothetical protein n=1 Tax=Myxococcus xanthus TaxID=34 RepID=UPI0011289963|nr:hypothetical protein [Myxococcus xanthus]QDE87768.1 hypothetical protein BHS06_01750 [Myxococcus xanthus]
MKNLGLMLFPLTVLLLAGSVEAASPIPGAEAPVSIGQASDTSSVKDEDGNDIELPKHDAKQTQCIAKCQEPVAKCISGCEGGDRKCQLRCAQTMERCARKCGVQL